MTTIDKYVPSKEDVVRITVIELPQDHKVGEGLYEWRYLSDKHLMDYLTLKKELVKIAPPHPQLGPEMVVERMLDRLQNFRRMYVNTVTGELTS